MIVIIIVIVTYYYHFISNEGGLNIFFLICLQYLLFLPKSRPVAGGGAEGARAPPQQF